MCFSPMNWSFRSLSPPISNFLSLAVLLFPPPKFFQVPTDFCYFSPFPFPRPNSFWYFCADQPDLRCISIYQWLIKICYFFTYLIECFKLITNPEWCGGEGLSIRLAILLLKSWWKCVQVPKLGVTPGSPPMLAPHFRFHSFLPWLRGSVKK